MVSLLINKGYPVLQIFALQNPIDEVQVFSYLGHYRVTLDMLHILNINPDAWGRI
jgi:hypothetical protein